MFHFVKHSLKGEPLMAGPPVHMVENFESKFPKVYTGGPCYTRSGHALCEVLPSEHVNYALDLKHNPEN